MSAYTEQTARQIVEELVEEMTGRAGLDGAWDSIDEETQEELIKAWIGIVNGHLIRVVET